MPIWTRSQHMQFRRQQKQMEEEDSMFETFGYIDANEQVVNKTIRDLEQDDKFNQLMEKYCRNKRKKCLIMLAK